MMEIDMIELRTDEITAEQIMTSAETVATVAENATVGQALELLSQADFRHLPVINKQREVVGILSDRDFQRIGVSTFDAHPTSDKVRARLDMRVTALMSGGVSVVDLSASLSEIIDLLLEQKIGAVPVVDEDTNQLAGIVSYVDVLRAIREELS
jgi:CBS-domain-containing membrane protein